MIKRIMIYLDREAKEKVVHTLQFCPPVNFQLSGGAQYGGGKRSSNLKPSSAPQKTSVPVTKPVSKQSATLKPTVNDASHTTKAAAAASHAPVVSKAVDGHGSSQSSELAALRAANEESARAYADLKAEMEGLEKERDFYFEKLRDVEVLLQDVEDKQQGNEVTAAIMKILYATADGFEQVLEEEGEPESDLPGEGADGEETF